MNELSCSLFSHQATPIDFSNLLQPQYAQCLMEDNDYLMSAFVSGQGGYAEGIGAWIAEAWKPHCAEVGKRIRDDILSSNEGKLNFLKESDDFQKSSLPLLHYLLEHEEHSLLSTAIKLSDTDINENHDGSQFILKAACHPNMEAYITLLEQGAEVRRVDSKGNSLFHYLAAEAHWPRIHALLENHPDILLVKNYEGLTGLDYIFESESFDCQVLLYHWLLKQDNPKLLKAFKEELLSYLWGRMEKVVQAGEMYPEALPPKKGILSGLWEMLRQLSEDVGLDPERGLIEKTGLNPKGEHPLQVALRHNFKD